MGGAAAFAIVVLLSEAGLALRILPYDTNFTLSLKLQAACQDELDCWEREKQDPRDSLEQDFGPRSKFRPEFDRTSCLRYPSFFYIGIGHAGSTSLANVLNSHPDLSYGAMKEHRYWLDTKSYNRYKNQFSVDCTQIKMTFDATPAYYHRAIGVEGKSFVQRFQKIHGQDSKIIVFLRNPIDAWFSQLYISDQPAKFDRLAEHVLEESKRKTYGDANWFQHYCYIDWVTHWKDVYHDGQILIVISEDFFSNQTGVLTDILKFVGAAPMSSFSPEQVNSGRRRVRAHPSHYARAKLLSDPFMKDCVKRLGILLRRDLGWGFL